MPPAFLQSFAFAGRKGLYMRKSVLMDFQLLEFTNMVLLASKGMNTLLRKKSKPLFDLFQQGDRIFTRSQALIVHCCQVDDFGYS